MEILKNVRWERYQTNLHACRKEHGQNVVWHVYSYNTLVAVQSDHTLRELDYWSVTTRKHVNYAARQLGLEVVHVH